MLLSIYVTLIYFTVFFIVGTIIKNNSIVDIGWGFGFVLTSWIVFFYFGNYSITSIIINIMVSLWGLRLFYHILKRNIFEKEDFRYAQWRKDWGKWVIPRAFLQVFMLQGLFQFLIGSTSYYLNANNLPFQWISVIGIVLWMIGYFFQVVGDMQLKTYIKDKNKKDPILKTGLWSITRHPNYFGESLMWISLYLFALLNGAPWYLVVSPITITAVLVFISTPLLEKSMSTREGWEEYASKTPMIIPIKLK